MFLHGTVARHFPAGVASLIARINMKSIPRKYANSVAINSLVIPKAMTSSIIATKNYSVLIFAARDDNKSVSITSRTMSSKTCFAWEEKRVEVTTPKELQRRLNRITRLSEEAQLCIQDVMECLDADHFKEELNCAEIAVGKAGIAYSELLEELALTDEGVRSLNEIRKAVAPNIELLREELRNIGNLKSKKN